MTTTKKTGARIAIAPQPKTPPTAAAPTETVAGLVGSLVDHLEAAVLSHECEVIHSPHPVGHAPSMDDGANIIPVERERCRRLLQESRWMVSELRRQLGIARE
jgi:hypothetical protein